MSIYTDIKLGKLEGLLEWLHEERNEHPSQELNKLVNRVEQQIVFMKLPEEEGRQYFDSVKDDPS